MTNTGHNKDIMIKGEVTGMIYNVKKDFEQLQQSVLNQQIPHKYAEKQPA